MERQKPEYLDRSGQPIKPYKICLYLGKGTTLVITWLQNYKIIFRKITWCKVGRYQLSGKIIMSDVFLIYRKNTRKTTFAPSLFIKYCDCFFTLFSWLGLRIELKHSQIGCFILPMEAVLPTLPMLYLPEFKECQGIVAGTIPQRISVKNCIRSLWYLYGHNVGTLCFCSKFIVSHT